LHIIAKNNPTIYELSTIFNMPHFEPATIKAFFTGAQQMAPQTGPSLMEVEPYQVSAKSKMSLFVALDVAKYYEKTDRDLIPSNMVWKVLKNFEVQHLAMKEKKDKTPPDAPKYQKQMGIPKWMESFKIHVRAIIGVRDIPLLYVIRDLEIVPPATPLAIDQPYYVEHGTVEEELIARTSHSHPLFRNDNGEVFDLLETSLHGKIIVPQLSNLGRPWMLGVHTSA